MPIFISGTQRELLNCHAEGIPDENKELKIVHKRPRGSIIESRGEYEMNPVQFKHKLDDVPPFGEMLLLGLQWFTIVVPILIIVGKIVAGLHFADPAEQIIYIQKIFL